MYTLNCKGRLLVLDKPVVMGIINVTPDSFYAGSRTENADMALQKAAKMLEDGAAILDIGGQSTRPSSTLLSEAEEMQRVIPVIAAVAERFPEAYISVDTFYSSVAKEAVAAGACMVNDVSGGQLDEKMRAVVGKLNVPFVLMHMKGTPQTMQEMAVYEDVTKEVLDYFIWEKEKLAQAGIRDVIIDPGFGFAKTMAHNFELMRNLDVFGLAGAPLLLGVSRKSFIYKTLGTTAGAALNGTTVIHTAGLLKGAAILRVHDVREAVEAITLCGML